MHSLWQDLRYGVRMLRRNPGFTVVAVLTLALGSGANTAMFSVVNSVLLRPLPYPDPEQLVRLSLALESGSTTSLTAAQTSFFTDHSSAFQSVAAYRGRGDLQLETGKGVEWVRTIRVSGPFFRTLAADPALGRSFAPEEERLGGPQALVLSDGLWRRVFGADAGIVGRQVALNGEGYTIIGIAPRGFAFVQPADVFTPLRFGNTVEDRGYNTEVVARLKTGTLLGRAQADMDVVFEQFRKAHDVGSKEKGIRTTLFHEWLVGDVQQGLWLLFTAVALLLLIACANVANLLLARGSSRQKEISIRLALGAGRGRLLKQLFTESLLLTLAGAATGLLGAVWVLDLLAASIPRPLPSADPIRLDGNVLVFTLLVTVVISILFGGISFLRTLKLEVHRSLKEVGAGGGYNLTRSRFRNLLVVVEVALSVILLVGSGLLIRSLHRLYQERLGFDPQDVVTMRTQSAPGKNQGPARVLEVQRQILERVEALPGVSSAAVISMLPLDGFSNFPVEHDGHPENSIGGMEYRTASSRYFETMRIPVVRGRAFLETDIQASQPVAIINERLARQWWPGGNPIGDRIVVGRFKGVLVTKTALPPREIIGVVGDVKIWLDYPDKPTIYIPVAQTEPSASTAWVVRAPLGVDLATALRQAVAQVDPGQRVTRILPMTQVVSSTVASRRFNTLLLGIFAGLATLLTSIGLYGVISYVVAQRRHEIGVRMALGAEQRDVLKLVIQQGTRLALVGVGIGLLGAWGLTRFLQTMLFGVTATDPVTFTAVSLLLVGVALLASYAPARRAARVDPMVALRYE